MPIAIVVPNLDYGFWVANALSKHPVIIDSTWKSKDVEKVLTTEISEAIVWIQPNSKRRSNKSMEIEEMIFNVTRTYQIGKYDASVAIFILCEQRVDDDLKGKVFEVHLKLNPEDCSYNESIIVRKDDDILSVLKEIPSISESNRINPLLIAAGLMNQCDCNSYYPIANRMDEDAEDYASEDGIAPKVVKTMVEYFKANRIAMYTLEKLKESDLMTFNNILILDEKKLYINEKLFKDSVGKITGKDGIDVLKSRLVSEKVLVPKWRGYTFKKGITTQNFDGRIYVMELDVTNFLQVTELKY